MFGETHDVALDLGQRQVEDYQHMFGDWTKKEM